MSFAISGVTYELLLLAECFLTWAVAIAVRVVAGAAGVAISASVAVAHLCLQIVSIKCKRSISQIEFYSVAVISSHYEWPLCTYAFLRVAVGARVHASIY